MKKIITLIILAAILLTGCEPRRPPSAEFLVDEPFSSGQIYKFDDGPIRCYVYIGKGISCVERSQ